MRPNDHIHVRKKDWTDRRRTDKQTEHTDKHQTVALEQNACYMQMRLTYPTSGLVARDPQKLLSYMCLGLGGGLGVSYGHASSSA